MKKIPDHAKKVFEGIIFDVYHWEQEMFDGSFATFEALKKRDTVSVIAVTERGTILINNEEQPVVGSFIALPGGMCEPSFSIEENIKKELLEETGYASSIWQEWFVSDPLKTTKIEWNNYFFIAKNCKKVSEQKLDPGEKVEVQEFTFEEFLDLRNNPKARNKDLFPILEKAANSEEEKQTLKDLLGITT